MSGRGDSSSGGESSSATPVLHSNPNEVVSSATVGTPVKEGQGIKAYALYKIKCTQRNGHVCEVFRRYSDFAWLHDTLQYDFPGAIIPPLPEKQLTGTFETDFLQNRTRFLQKFLDRILDHPELKQARILIRFLTMTDQPQFQEMKGIERASPGALMKWITQTGARAYKSVAGLAGFSSSDLPTTKDDEVFEDIKKYVGIIEPQIVNTAKFAEKIVADRKDVASCHFDIGESFTALGQTEAGSIGTDLNSFGRTVDQLAQLGQEHAQEERHVFVEPMKDMVRNLEELKEAIKRRTEAHQMLLGALSDFAKSEKYLQKVDFGGKASKLDSARSDHDRNERLVAESRASLKAIDARLQKEIARFQKRKLDDFTDCMLQYATHQAQYFQKEEELWSGVSQRLERSGSPQHGQ